MTLNSDKFNCQKCPFGRHCDKSNPAPYDKWEISKINFKSNTCLLPMVSEDSLTAIDLYAMHRQGVLAFSGGYLEQPYKYIQMMKQIRAHLHES